jgi:hypothetical protein
LGFSCSIYGEWGKFEVGGNVTYISLSTYCGTPHDYSCEPDI